MASAFAMFLLILSLTVCLCAGQHDHHHGAHDHSNDLSCPKAFDAPACRSFIQSDAALSLMHDLCGQVPFAVGCSLHRGCGHGTDGSDLCFPANHLLAICLEFPDLKPCSKFKDSCGPLNTLNSCKGIKDLKAPSTSEAYSAVRAMCKEHNMDGCDNCRATDVDMNEIEKFSDACMDPFGTLAAMCNAMDMTECDDWKAWCKSDVIDGKTDLCPMDHSTHEHGMESNEGVLLRAGDDACIENPKEKRCEMYRYPKDSIEEDLLSLCEKEEEGMPWMIGCSIRNSCREDGRHDGLCSPFTLLATLCSDMPGMIGCRRYNSLCDTDSLVHQCHHHRPIPGSPGTMMTQSEIVEACSSHSMPACTQCPQRGSRCPKTLETMSELCFTMPSMAFCGSHRRFCTATNSAFAKFCDPSGGDYLPPMRMYFHFGHRDVILFKDWIPESTTGYVASFLAVVVLGIAVQVLKAYRQILEHRWYKQLTNSGDCATCTDKGPGCEPECEKQCADDCGTASNTTDNHLRRLSRNLVRGAISGVTTCLDFFLMLIAMTFNVGLFIAVVLGVSLGAVVFGYVTEGQYKGMPLSLQTLRRGTGAEGCCG